MGTKRGTFLGVCCGLRQMRVSVYNFLSVVKLQKFENKVMGRSRQVSAGNEQPLRATLFDALHETQ